MMKETNFGSCNYNKLSESFENAKKDKAFKKLVEEIGLKDEELMKHTSKLEEAAEEKNNCQGCPGLMNCKNRVLGYRYTPKNNENRLTFSFDACKYELDRLEEEATLCNYYEMPDSLKLARMKDIMLDDANRVGVIKWLKNFYDNFDQNKKGKGLYLHGSFGSGKTYLICAMLNELAKKGVSITIVYYPELLRSLKEAFSSDFSNRIDKLKKCDILFLDDVGAEAVTNWSRDEILGTILQYRMDSSLPTFFTSNLNIEELEGHLSDTKNGVDKVKARRIIERIKFLTEDMELVSKNRRN